MSRILDPGDPLDGDDAGRYDTSQLFCAWCGSNDYQVKQWPVPDGWYGGRGECNVCGKTFGIREVDENKIT